MSGRDLAPVEPADGLDLTLWAAQAQQVHQIAVSLSKTSFVPRSMREHPHEVTGAILAGRELGLHPMAALRSINVIEGVPSMNAIALRGLVLSRGHQVWVEESTETRAVVCGQRNASGAKVQKSVWTVDRAQRAGLAGKRNWQTNPTAMLVARATAEVCRLIAADVLIGMPYSTEELADGVDLDAPVAVKAKPTMRQARRKPLPTQPAPVPELTRPQSEPEPMDEDPMPLTERSRDALMAAYRDAGISDRADRIAHACEHLGRVVVSLSEITEAEAVALLATLTEGGGRGDG